MIEYEKFEKLMRTYKDICDKERALDNVLHEISSDFGGFYQPDVHSIILELLETVVSDDSKWIDYYIYELDWGKDWKEGMVTDKDGNDIPLRTIKDLYNAIETDFWSCECNDDE